MTRQKIVLLTLIIQLCSLIQAQTLADYAKSINSQSPSKWINNFYRLGGAKYVNHTFTLKYEIKAVEYFDVELMNKNSNKTEKLVNYVISSLYYSKHYNALFNEIIDRNANLEFILSVPNSKTKSETFYTSIALKNILLNNVLSKEELFLQGHVIATNIGCRTELDDGLVLEKCAIKNRKLIYYVSCNYLSNDKVELEVMKGAHKSIFGNCINNFPAAETLIRSCLVTKTDICWKVMDSKMKRDFFTITFGEKDFKKSLGIK